MKLVVGLGNPGTEYAKHRHNVAWMTMDLGMGFFVPDKKFNGEYNKVGENVFLRPHTFMNSSGESVLACANFYKIEAKDIIVIHDEMDIPFGEIRTKIGGGHAGHNGVKSVINQLGTKDFTRVRLGIGRPSEGVEVLQHVLGNFKPEEHETLSKMLKESVEVVYRLLGSERSEEA